jgi:cytochrome c553
MEKLGLTLASTLLALGLLLTGAAEAGDAAIGKRKAKMCQTCHGIDGLARITSQASPKSIS